MASTAGAGSADWREVARELSAEELGARRLLPSLTALQPFSKARWQDLRALGYEYDVEEVSTGRVDRTRLLLKDISIRTESDGKRWRLAELAVGRARTWLDADRTQRVCGAWRKIGDERHDSIGRTVEALGDSEAERYIPRDEGWEPGLSIARGYAGRQRCLACRKRIEDRVAARAGLGLGARPDPGTTRHAQWLAEWMGVGEVHLACASEQTPTLLAAAIAGTPHADRISALAPYRTAGGSIVKGPLTRCHHCRRPISKNAWRLVSANELHIACAREVAPAALAGALEDAPNDFSLE